MISINDFRAFIAQLKTIAEARLNQAGTPATVAHTVVAVQENHLVNILKDKPGIILAASAPQFTVRQASGYDVSESTFLIFVLYKYSPQALAKESEYAQYTTAQRLMSTILQIINGESPSTPISSAGSGSATAPQPPAQASFSAGSGSATAPQPSAQSPFSAGSGYAAAPQSLDTLLCTTGIRLSAPVTVEWEYNIYGGYSGLSARVTLTDPSGFAV